MPTRKKLVAGNWKMNGSFSRNSALLEEVLAGVSGLGCEILVCPPFPYLAQVGRLLAGSGVVWGGQNISSYEQGAYTGEVAGEMLIDLGCRYVLVGHSERRSLFGESDSLVAEKFSAAQKASLIPILCVGESLDERNAGLTEFVVMRQLNAVLAVCGVDALRESVIAYEPVWAIGTGVTATPVQVQEVHALIRQRLAQLSRQVAEVVRIVYGGSVKPENASTLFAQQDVDGGLVGGASLVASDFLAICRAAT